MAAVYRMAASAVHGSMQSGQSSSTTIVMTGAVVRDVGQSIVSARASGTEGDHRTADFFDRIARPRATGDLRGTPATGTDDLGTDDLEGGGLSGVYRHSRVSITS
jgi:hypothetical protein